MSETKLEVVERYGGFAEADVSALALDIEMLMGRLDLDISEEHFKETPRRVAAMLLYFTQDIPLEAVLKDGFEDSGHGAMIVQTQIPFKGLCAHHLLPFFGTAAVGYIPNGRIVGLSKLTRLVAAAGLRAPSTQEAISEAIADTLMSGLKPKGVAVLSRAQHGCMAVRGVNAPGTLTTVSVLRGDFHDVDATRQEFLSLVGTSW